MTQKSGPPAVTGQGIDPDALVAAGLVLSRLARQSERALGALQITLTQYRILSFLVNGTTGTATLADHLQVTPPSITGVVDGLLARGLVERRPDATDLRRAPVALTKLGSQTLAAAEKVVAGVLAEILSYLEPNELVAVMDGFRLCELALDRRFAAAR